MRVAATQMLATKVVLGTGVLCAVRRGSAHRHFTNWIYQRLLLFNLI
jgi:hypothetical protein